MAITTYAELQTAIGNWLDHTLFTARVPEFIALFEACANRRLRVRQQEAMTNLTPDANGSAALPADYLALRRVTWTGAPRRDLRRARQAQPQDARRRARRRAGDGRHAVSPVLRSIATAMRLEGRPRAVSGHASRRRAARGSSA